MLTLNLEDTLKSSLSDQIRKKKQKLVKHKRKNWKKTDIDEVEQGIDDLRQQKIHGGVLSEKRDEDLFFINKEKTSINEDVVSSKKKKNLSLEEKLGNLRCYKNLQPDPLSYPAHVINNNLKPDENSKRQQKLQEKKAIKSKNKLSKIAFRLETNKENTIVLKNNLKKKKINKTVTRPKDRKNLIIETNFEKDIWKAGKNIKIDEIEENFLKYTKDILTKKPENPILPRSAVPKLEVPHPGSSYNPDYDDHQNLLLKAHLIELEKLKKEQKEMRKKTNNIKKMSWDEIEKLWLEEMAVDSLFNQTEIHEENSSADTEALNKKSRTKKEKKNNEKVKRKRKQLLEKIMLKQKENEKNQRIQQNEIFRLKSIKKEINQEQKLREEVRFKKETEQKQKELFTPKRLGSLKYEEPEIELKLSSEITGNLRTLKPEGNIMADRYKSLQKRNIIEPRDKAKSQKKYWKKKFEKKNAYEKTNFVK